MALFFGHEELPAVFLSLLLDLHLPHEVVLVFDLVFDVLEVLRRLAVGLLLQEILILVAGQFRRCENVLNGVGDNEILVRNETLDGLLVFLRDRWLGCDASLDLANLFFRHQNGVACSLHSECSCIRL